MNETISCVDNMWKISRQNICPISSYEFSKIYILSGGKKSHTRSNRQIHNMHAGTVLSGIRTNRAIEIRLKNDLNSDRFLWGFFCRQQWTYSYGKRAQTNQSRKFAIYFLPKSAAILTQKKTASWPLSGPYHTPLCVLGELWRAHTDKKTGEAHGLI